MPAYRSSAEADVRDAVVARLRQSRPEARIIHEINCSTYGPTRIDVLAVSPDEIIAVEVKSAKDKLDRLPKQIASMKGCAHHVIAALHQKFLVEKSTNKWAAHFERDGHFYLRAVPPDIEASGVSVWIFPETRRAMMGVVEGGFDHMASWQMPQRRFDNALPGSAIDILWRDEMAWLCGKLGIATGRRSTMTDMAAALRWNCSGRELTKGVCAALRSRHCVEADPIIEVAA
jgi:hypothetical protein